MPFTGRKLAPRRPSPNPLDSNIGLLAVFAVAVLIIHLMIAGLLQRTAGEGAASPALAILDSD